MPTYFKQKHPAINQTFKKINRLSTTDKAQRRKEKQK